MIQIKNKNKNKLINMHQTNSNNHQILFKIMRAWMINIKNI